MAVCGRCFLCDRKFECVAGRYCESCAPTDDDRPLRIVADGHENDYADDGKWMGGRICVACVEAIGETDIGTAVSGVLRFAHAKNGESA